MPGRELTPKERNQPSALFLHQRRFRNDVTTVDLPIICFPTVLKLRTRLASKPIATSSLRQNEKLPRKHERQRQILLKLSQRTRNGRNQLEENPIAVLSTEKKCITTSTHDAGVFVIRKLALNQPQCLLLQQQHLKSLLRK